MTFTSKSWCGGRRLCGGGALPRRTGRTPITTLTLPRRIAEIDGDHGLSCRGMAADTVRLKPPLLDCGNRGAAQNKISANNFQIFDAAIAPNYRLQYYWSVKFLGQRVGWIHWIHDVNQHGSRCLFTGPPGIVRYLPALSQCFRLALRNDVPGRLLAHS